MKICALFFFSILALHFLNSCESSSSALVGDWKELSNFDGVPRSDAVGFAIGTNGYLGTGFDGNERLNDFWEYDISRNTWTQKADLPGIARNGAVGFGTDTKGYIGTGYDGVNKLNDFYEYDPSTNIWTQKANFGGTARYSAVGMAINNKGYIGTGWDGTYLKDFWQYDPDTDTWTQVSSYGGEKRRDAACFVINGIGYITTGIDNGTYDNDLFGYDPTTDTWTEKRKITNYSPDTYDNLYTDIIGIYKVGFAINGKGYLATGGQTSGVKCWEYDPVTDLWTEKTAFEGSSRADAVGFAVGNLGYVATGMSGTYYYDDLWSFDPEAVYNQYDK